MEEYDINHILSSIFDCGDSDSWNPSEKITLVTKEIEKYELDIKHYLSDSDYDVIELLKEGKELCDESESMIEEMAACKKVVEEETMAEIIKSMEDHDLISKELETVTFTLNIIYDIVQCSKYLKEFDENKREDRYYLTTKALSDLTAYLDNPAEGFKRLSMYSNFRSFVDGLWEELLEMLQQRWDQLFSYALDEAYHRTTVHINILFTNDLDTNDLLQALLHCNQLQPKVSHFAMFLLDQVLKPMIYKDCSVYVESEEKTCVTIPLRIPYKPSYDAVIANTRMLVQYLSNKLNINAVANFTIMSMVGTEIGEEFGDILIRDCLVDTIPNTIDELNAYGTITSEIESFQRFMVSVKFFPESYTVLQYTANIDVLFATRSSEHFLETARAIMLKDLSAMMAIGFESVPNDELNPGKVDEGTEEALQVLDKAIPKSLFYFPRCMISKSAQELLDLVFTIMEQAVQCSDFVCKKLYSTTRLIFELYDAVVPYHHESFLQTIPQYVALFHNNTMYLAHNLLTLGEKWATLMQEREVPYPINFVDLVHKMRELAYKHLTIHMQQQRKQILDNIRASDLNCIIVKDVLGKNAEQAIRQCLRQLQLLKNVWVNVLPVNVFTRLMATLVNMFVEELIHRVCTVEDISVEMATQLTEIYTIVVQKAPNNFQKPNDIEEHVKCWLKLQALLLVLGGSLSDIEVRWAQGSGPLARHFSADELRNLIKALFQNTQLRANLLSKIK